MQLKCYRSIVRDVNYLCIMLGLTVMSINPAVANLFTYVDCKWGRGLKIPPAYLGSMSPRHTISTATPIFEVQQSNGNT